MPHLTWNDPESMALALTARFTDLHRWVTVLEGFRDDPKVSSEGKLEAIQMAWYEEWKIV